jgi:hypothetical protein
MVFAGGIFGGCMHLGARIHIEAHQPVGTEHEPVRLVWSEGVPRFHVLTDASHSTLDG